MQTQKERCWLVGTGYRFRLEASKEYYLNNCGSPSVIILYGRFASHVQTKQLRNMCFSTETAVKMYYFILLRCDQHVFEMKIVIILIRCIKLNVAGN